MPVVDIAEFEDGIVATYPGIPWREPLKISVHRDDGGVDTAFACRICIAAYGMKAADVPSLPQTKEAFDLHVLEKHPKKVADA